MHTDQEDKKPLSFISGLTESQLIRSRHSLSDFTGKDVTEAVYIYLLALEVLRQEDPRKTIVSVYARNAVRYGNWDKFRISGNDLYLLLHLITGEEADESRAYLKDSERSTKFLNQVVVDEVRLKNYLRGVEAKRDESNRVFFFNIEQRLKISNPILKQVRRSIVDWAEQDRGEREEAVRRLARAFRGQLYKSELRKMIDQLLKEIDNQ